MHVFSLSILDLFLQCFCVSTFSLMNHLISASYFILTICSQLNISWFLLNCVTLIESCAVVFRSRGQFLENITTSSCIITKNKLFPVYIDIQMPTLYTQYELRIYVIVDGIIGQPGPMQNFSTLLEGNF